MAEENNKNYLTKEEYWKDQVERIEKENARYNSLTAKMDEERREREKTNGQMRTILQDLDNTLKGINKTLSDYGVDIKKIQDSTKLTPKEKRLLTLKIIGSLIPVFGGTGGIIWFIAQILAG